MRVVCASGALHTAVFPPPIGVDVCFFSGLMYCGLGYFVERASITRVQSLLTLELRHLNAVLHS